MIIGDLNELSSFQDKLASHKGNSTGYNNFKEILDDNILVVIDYI